MKLSLPRLVLLLAGAAVLGYLFGHDHPAPQRAMPPDADQRPAIAPGPAATPWQAPPYAASGGQQTPAGPTYQPDLPERQAPARSYQFRPQPRDRGSSDRGPDAAAPYYAPPVYAAPQAAPPSTPGPRRYAPQGPGYGMPDNFRPLEDQEQTRRWHGGYRRMSAPPTQFAVPGSSRYGIFAGPT